MRPISSQPGGLYTTVKTHKFNSLDKITAENLNFGTIISQVGTYTNSAKVMAGYLKPFKT